MWVQKKCRARATRPQWGMTQDMESSLSTIGDSSVPAPVGHPPQALFACELMVIGLDVGRRGEGAFAGVESSGL